MGVACIHLADNVQALDCFEQQLQIARELGDRVSESNAVGNLANIYQVTLVDYARSWDYRQQEIGLCSEIGSSRGLTWAVGNLSELYLDLGDYASVLLCGQRHLQLCIDTGERLGITLALGRMARVFAKCGDYQEAERLLQRDLALGRMLRIPYYLCYALGNGVELYLEQRRYLEARQLNDEALDLAREAKRTEVEFTSLVLSIRLSLALHEIDRPSAIRELEALQPVWPSEQEQAALHYELRGLQHNPVLSRVHVVAAADLYHSLYRRTCWIEYRRRYEELTGETLPNPPPLPAPPTIATADHADLDELLAQVDQIIIELATQSALSDA
jgi:tetratricopeptide (TPR) repeat protein